MRKKIHNVELVKEVISGAIDTVGDHYASKAIAHRHQITNVTAWAKTDISMRAIERLSHLGLRLEALIAAHLREREVVRGEEFADVADQIKAVAGAFDEVMGALIAGLVIAATVDDVANERETVNNADMAHEALSHGLRKAEEFHLDHHRDFSVWPALSRFKNAIKCTVDSKYLDAIRDVTIAVRMIELDLDPPQYSTNENPLNLTGKFAVYVGD